MTRSCIISALNHGCEGRGLHSDQSQPGQCEKHERWDQDRHVCVTSLGDLPLVVDLTF